MLDFMDFRNALLKEKWDFERALKKEESDILKASAIENAFFKFSYITMPETLPTNHQNSLQSIANIRALIPQVDPQHREMIYEYSMHRLVQAIGNIYELCSKCRGAPGVIGPAIDINRLNAADALLPELEATFKLVLQHSLKNGIAINEDILKTALDKARNLATPQPALVKIYNDLLTFQNEQKERYKREVKAQLVSGLSRPNISTDLPEDVINIIGGYAAPTKKEKKVKKEDEGKKPPKPR